MDLGKAAARCSDMQAYLCISFYLFWVAVKVGEKYKPGNQPLYPTETYRNQLRKIAVRYVRNYVSWVLYGELALQAFMDKGNAGDQSEKYLPVVFVCQVTISFWFPSMAEIALF